MGRLFIDLKSLRKRNGWTQAQAAERLGFSRTYICDIENGNREISKSMMIAIAEVFAVPYEEFFKVE